MPTARELRTPGAACVGVDGTPGQAVEKTRDLGVGSLPIGGEGKLRSTTGWRQIRATTPARR